MDFQAFIYCTIGSKLPIVQEVGLLLQGLVGQVLGAKYRGSKPRPTDLYWSPGEPCVAMYSMDGSWYRCGITIPIVMENFSLHVPGVVCWRSPRMVHW